MIENNIPGYLFDKPLSQSTEEKCMAFQSMAWCLTVYLKKH